MKKKKRTKREGDEERKREKESGKKGYLQSDRFEGKEEGK
jgi:hypothetical protein